MIVQSKFVSWLRDSLNESNNKQYRHRLFTEHIDKREEILDELSLYVKNAHKDAKRYLREVFENTLDPFAGSISFDPAEGYPELLHMQTLKGYFGEIFAGLIAEHFSPFGENGWKVPVFLFRYHTVAFQELERIRQTGDDAKKLPGRTGDDCLAFQLDSDGQIIRYLYCEAKCTSKGNVPERVTEAYKKVSDSNMVDLQQIIRVLQRRCDSNWEQWILALQRLSFALRNHLTTEIDYKAERYDMVSYVCGESPKRGTRLAWLPIDQPLEVYKAGRRLEIAEIHLPEIAVLIQKVYGKKVAT